MSAVGNAALGLRFILELCLLAAFAFWGYQTGGSTLSKIILLIVAPLGAAVVWGLFIAPKSTFHPPGSVRLVLEIALFALAAVGLAATGRGLLALILIVAFFVDDALLYFSGKW